MKNLTLGWEFEAIAAANDVCDFVNTAHDGSVQGESVEYRLAGDAVHSPLLGIRVLRKLLMDKRIAVNASCGFHVHMGIHDVTRNFLKTWGAWCMTLGKMVEKEAFDALPKSRDKNNYCQRWDKKIVAGGLLKLGYRSAKGENPYRYFWINTTEIFRPNGIRTVEIRSMGESKRYVYLLAWISACVLLGDSAQQLVTDPSLLEEMVERMKSVYGVIKYIKYHEKDTEACSRHCYSLLSQTEILPNVPTFSRLSSVEDALKLADKDQDMQRKYHAPNARNHYTRPNPPIRNCECSLCLTARTAPPVGAEQEFRRLLVGSQLFQNQGVTGLGQAQGGLGGQLIPDDESATLQINPPVDPGTCWRTPWETIPPSESETGEEGTR